MHLTDIMEPAWIKVPLLARSKEGLIAEMIDVLASGGTLGDPAEALQAVLAREAVRTTGIGNGLALPHGKYNGVRRLVMAMGRTAEPVDFQSIDGKCVDLVVLLLGPREMTGEHIQALARIARFLSIDSFRRQLRAAAGPQEFYQVIQKQEQAAEASAGRP